MKNLKKNLNKVLPMLVALIVLQSCSDKFDEQQGQLNAGDVDFTQTENMIQAITGAYQIFATRGWEEPLLLSVRGDDVNAGGLGDQQPFADTDRFNYTKDYWMYNSLWNLHYRDIVSLNTSAILINNYKNFADAENAAKAGQYLAEIKVMRAWLQFNLSRVWGNVFIIETNTPDTEIVDGVAPKEEVMQYISDLMDEAIPLLPNARPNERQDIPGGVTRYTAYAIKALANLELKNYQGVADACAEIINSGKFSLYSDFYQLFKKPGELSDESLLEMQYSDFGQETGGTFYHLYAPYGPQNWEPARANASPGWGFYEPSMKYIKFMLDRGETVRLQTSVIFTNRGIAELQSDPQYATLPGFISNTTPDGDVFTDYPRALFASGKHYLPSVQLTNSRNDYGAGKNNLVIRYAEILLMYAEALAQGANGSSMSATQAVNMVRQRANMPDIANATLQNVLDEKFAEMAMEWGVRYYDMVRLQNFAELSYDGRTFSPEKALLPYPQAQVDLLPLE